MLLQIGDIAPDFTLMAEESKQITLSKLRGKNVVLYFYPKDNTPGCTIEACDFSSRKEQFEKLNAVVIGISKDDIKSHYKFKNRYSLSFDLASDPEGAICTKYGTFVEKSMFGKKYMGITRATFLINAEGKISYIWPDVSVLGHAKEVLAVIEKQQND
ncbi:MAG: thioredoxin-dependent thiol peroxidase [Pseudomonadota bacterium]